MLAETVTLSIPVPLYQRLLNTALATQRSLEEVMLHALKVGSPPTYDDVPDEFQAELAILDRLDNDALWQIATHRKAAAEMERYDVLLDLNRNGMLADAERLELMDLRHEADRFMLRKAHAAVLLRWRGRSISTL
jgi:hypothetical protein